MYNHVVSSVFSPLVLGLALALSRTAPAAHAQSGAFQVPLTTVEAEREEKEEDVGYTSGVASSATRLPESILDTPRAVNVVPESVLEDRAIFDPQEAIQHVSGVKRGFTRTGVGEAYAVRGFVQQSLFKDGFRAGQSSASFSPFTFEGPTDVANLERIEVLKGPSALLYGRGEPGGTVNYITRVPDFENRFSLQQHFGSFDFYRTELHLNGVLAPLPVAARLDAAYQTNESFIDFVEAERFFAAPSFRWEIGPETALTLRGELANDDHSTSLGFPVVDGRILDLSFDRYFGEPGFSAIKANTLRGLATLDHRWDEQHATTASLHGVRSTGEGGNILLFNFAGPLQNPDGTINRIAELVDFRSEYLTARLDHTWDVTVYAGTPSAASGRETGWRFPAVDNRLLFSLEFDRQTVDGARTLSGHSPLDPFNPVYTGYAPQPLFPDFPDQFFDDSAVEADATSILLLDRLYFGDTVILSFGGRYEWFDANSKLIFLPAGLPFPNSDDEVDEETFNPVAGLVIKPLPHLSLYGSYAESTFSFQNIGLTTVTGETLDEERSRQYEVGVKLELLNGRFFASTALFQIEKSDVAGTDPDNPFFSINAGEERSRGIEVDLGGEPLPGWRLTANYAYIDAEITDDPAGVTTGNHLGGVPEHSGGLFTTYEFQAGLLKGFGGGGGVFVSDRVELDDFSTGKLPGYEQVDAVLFYRRKNWTAQLNVKNLLDEEFFYNGGGEVGPTEVQRAPERTIIVSVSFKF
ncbi:MAG: TonB-dependent siderophore receptor [Candidatus Binatia bacterium]